MNLKGSIGVFKLQKRKDLTETENRSFFTQFLAIIIKWLLKNINFIEKPEELFFKVYFCITLKILKNIVI